MFSLFRPKQQVRCQLNRVIPNSHRLPLSGKFKVELQRVGALVKTFEFNNDIVNQGKNDLFDTFFHDATPVASSSWFIGLISSVSYSALAAADTMASHAGWTEFTSYTQATRVAWGPGAAASQSITNSSPATFDINASGTVKGVFVCTNSTKSGTSGRLWATALFGADVPVVNTDQLRITYSVSA